MKSPPVPQPTFPPPEWVGCFKCGKAWPAAEAISATCEVCGKTVGICFTCARVMFFRKIGVPLHLIVRDGGRFIAQSMEWHLENRHHWPSKWQRILLSRMPKTRPTVELF